MDEEGEKIRDRDCEGWCEGWERESPGQRERGCLRYRELGGLSRLGVGDLLPHHSGLMLLCSHLPSHTPSDPWPLPSPLSPITSAQKLLLSPTSHAFPHCLQSPSLYYSQMYPFLSSCLSAVQKALVWLPPTASPSWLPRPSEIHLASTCLPCLPPAHPAEFCTLGSGHLIKENSRRARTFQHYPSFLKAHPGATT